MGKRLILAFSVKNKQRKYYAFTLIECLFSLFVLSFICLFFSILIKNISITDNYLKNTTEKEWEIFLIQLENELKTCTYEMTQPSRIIFKNKKNNHSVVIEYKLEKIVKVDNGGYQPLLMNIKQATFYEQDKQIYLNIIFTNNQLFDGKLILTKEQVNGD